MRTGSVLVLTLRRPGDAADSKSRNIGLSPALPARCAVRASVLDWRAPLPPDLAGCFDTVLLCDVLYSVSQIKFVAAATLHLLAPGHATPRQAAEQRACRPLHRADPLLC